MASIIGEMVKTEYQAVESARDEWRRTKARHMAALTSGSDDHPGVKEVAEKSKEIIYYEQLYKMQKDYFRNNPNKILYLWAMDFQKETDLKGPGHRTLMELAAELKIDEKSEVYRWVHTMSPRDFVKKVEPYALAPAKPVKAAEKAENRESVRLFAAADNAKTA